MYFYFSIQQVDQILHGTPEDGRPGDGHNAIGESVQREQSLHAPLASAADDNSKNFCFIGRLSPLQSSVYPLTLKL